MPDEDAFRLPLVTLFVVLLLSSAATLWLSSAAQAHEETPTELFEGVENLFAPYEAVSGIRGDGMIGAGEYNEFGHSADEEEGVHLYMEHDGTFLYLALVNGLGGWAAVGFGEDEGATFDANVVWWDGTAGVAEDRFIPTLTDELETLSDQSQAGTVDIDQLAVTSDGTTPVYEFRIPLISGDPRDAALVLGRVHFGFVTFGTDAPAPDKGLSGEDTHFFQLYLLRSTDDPLQIYNLFEGVTPGPTITIPTVALVSLGVLGLGWRFLGAQRRGKE